jgi:hypothetical protein
LCNGFVSVTGSGSVLERVTEALALLTRAKGFLRCSGTALLAILATIATLDTLISSAFPASLLPESFRLGLGSLGCGFSLDTFLMGLGFRGFGISPEVFLLGLGSLGTFESFLCGLGSLTDSTTFWSTGFSRAGSTNWTDFFRSFCSPKLSSDGVRGLSGTFKEESLGTRLLLELFVLLSPETDLLGLPSRLFEILCWISCVARVQLCLRAWLPFLRCSRYGFGASGFRYGAFGFRCFQTNSDASF